MLSEEARLVLDFVEECRNQLMIKDEYHKVSEKMFTTLYQVGDFLKTTKEGEELFRKLEDSIFNTIELAKTTYFEFGESFNCINEERLITNLEREAV